MPISNVAVDGPITAEKINEIIDAINALQFSWVNFNGTGSVAIRASVGNIAGVTRLGGGSYRVSFTTPMSNANYAIAGNCSQTAGNDTGFVMITSMQTTHFDIHCRNDDGGIGDCQFVTLVVVGG